MSPEKPARNMLVYLPERTCARNAPMSSLPAVIFQFALSPYKEWQQLAWTGALLITLTVLALSIAARALQPQGPAK